VHRLAGAEPPAAHRGDGVRKATRAEAELEATAAEDVQGGGGPGEHGGWSQRQAEHVAGQPDALGAGGHKGQ
jgi:hypothetical protein